MMNLVCRGDVDPAAFSSDEKVAPVATRVSTRLQPRASDENEPSASVASRRAKAKASDASGQELQTPLVVRFVRARLFHFQMHLLGKIGGGVSVSDSRPGAPSSAELAEAEALIRDVQSEVRALGPELVSRELALLDVDFTQSLNDAVARIGELQDAAGVRSTVWYGAACEQVEESARLLVANRRLTRQNEELTAANRGLTEKLARTLAAKEAATAEHLREAALLRQRAAGGVVGVVPGMVGLGANTTSLTAKLQAGLAMKEAERAASGATGGGSSASAPLDPQQVGVARSLRLQDEVIVLRKATTTLQLSLSRVQAQYGTLLDEHEHLKAEIRRVVAEQDAEETDIRRLFVEREREYDAAMKLIASQTRKIEQLEKQHQRSMMAASRSAAAPASASILGASRTLTREESLAAALRARKEAEMFAKRRNSNIVFGGVEDDDDDFLAELDASHRTGHSSSFRIPVADPAPTSKQKKAGGSSGSLAARMKAMRDRTVPALTTALGSKPPSIDKVLSDAASAASDGDDVTDDADDDDAMSEPADNDNIFTETLGDSMNGGEDDGPLSIGGSGAASPQQPLSGLSSARAEQQQQRRIARSHASTMTDGPRFKPPIKVTVGTQTFLKLPQATNSNNAGGSSSEKQQLQQQQQAAAAAAAASGEQGAGATASESAAAAAQLVDKLVRLVNRQSSVIERFLAEHVANNIVLRRRDLARLLKQFGVPLAPESNASTSWQGVLYRFPLSQPLSELEAQADAALERCIATASALPSVECAVQTDERGAAAAATASSDQNNASATPYRAGSRRPGSAAASPMHAAAPASMPSSFWNANAAVEALRRVYVDAGRLIDSVEREQELVAAEQHASVGDAVLSNEIPAAAAAAAGARATPHRGRPASAAGSGAAAAAAAAAASPATAPSTAAIERVATVQFFAIRDLESSTNLLLQRLNTAKEEYVRRFAERSSLLNQTLGHVSKTHPREANRLSRLAKSVQQARAVVPWMTGFVEHFDVGGGAPGSGGLFSSPSSHGGGGMALPVAPQSPPIVFRAADIIMGKVHPALSHG